MQSVLQALGNELGEIWLRVPFGQGCAVTITQRILEAESIPELERLHGEAQTHEDTFDLFKRRMEDLLNGSTYEDHDTHGEKDQPEADAPSSVPADEPRLLPPPQDPMRVARKFVEDEYIADEVQVLRHWRGDFYCFEGICWRARDSGAIKAQLYTYLEHAVFEIMTEHGIERVPWRPTKAKVANVTEAVQATTHLLREVQPPAWLPDAGPDGPRSAGMYLGQDPSDLVVVDNGILHVPSRGLVRHDARLFVANALPFDFDPDAPRPVRWFAFLQDLFGDDKDSMALLQEMYGYALSGDTSLQKIMLLVGPPRSGKGVSANVLTGLLGRANVGAPTLATLTTNFGLQELIGKSLAIVSDARLGPRANVQALAERLLSISGEDSITVDRKYKVPWTGPLGVRFLILTNELPRFTDASGALAKRFVVLVLSKSFYGRENTGLLQELLPELPGILNWALDGLDRLREQGHFTQPVSARDVIRELEDLASPLSAFLRDRCLLGRDLQVSVHDLWAEWKEWAEDQGQRPGTLQVLGRDLRAAVPGLHVIRPRDGDERTRWYVGVALK